MLRFSAKKPSFLKKLGFSSCFALSFDMSQPRLGDLKRLVTFLLLILSDQCEIAPSSRSGILVDFLVPTTEPPRRAIRIVISVWIPLNDYLRCIQGAMPPVARVPLAVRP